MISTELISKATKNILPEINSLNLLWPGSQGKSVFILQKMLSNCGYNVSKSGIYDEATTNAVKNLQHKLGIAADGIAGPAFFNKFKFEIPDIKKNIKLSETTGYKNLIASVPAADEVQSAAISDDIISDDNASGKSKSNVFVSYSHKDKKWMDRLRVFIKPIEKNGYVNVWDDTEIEVGSEWKKEIEKILTIAKAAVLLISADFMASKFITENELPPLLSKSSKTGMKIIPVIISPCLLGELSKYQAVNSPDETLVDMNKGERERTWVKVIENLTSALNN